jgi:serine/threonine-protein kinase RsbW
MTAEPTLREGLRSSRIIGGDLRVVLNNTLASIEDGRREIEKHLEPLALKAIVTHRLEVVFEELVANIVRHGFAPGADQTILVEVAARPGHIALTVSDDGAPFNPLEEAPEPKPYESLDTARIGGLGVALVRKLSAAVRYEALGADAAIDLDGRAFAPTNRISVEIAT